MASKRKRQSESSTPRRNKRVRHTHKAGELSHPAQQGKTSNSDEVYHIIKDILDENENQYLIDWEGLDPKTGRSYKPSWQPKENANAEAVEDWEKIKRERTAPSAAEGRPKRGRPPKGSIRSTRGTPVKPSRQSRRAKVVITDSSTVASTQDPSEQVIQPPREGYPVEDLECQFVSSRTEGPQLNKGKQPVQGSPTHQTKDLEIEDSFEQDKQTPAPKKLPAVELSQFSASERQQYKYFPTLSSSNPSAESQQEPSVNILQSSQEYQRTEVSPAQPGHEIVIPDSQSFPESSNLVLSSNNPDSNQQHHRLNSSPPAVEDEKGDRSTGSQSFQPSNGPSLEHSYPESVLIEKTENHRETTQTAQSSWLTAATGPYTAIGTQNVVAVGSPERRTREENATKSSRFQPSAEGLSAIPIARPSSEPPSYADSQRSAAETVDPELTFQTQVPLAVASNSTQDRPHLQDDLGSSQQSDIQTGYRSQSTGEIWQSGQGVARPEQAPSQISTESDHLHQTVPSQDQSENSQRSRNPELSVLSHKDPDSVRKPEGLQLRSQLSVIEESLGSETRINRENTLPSIEGGGEVSSSLIPTPPSHLTDTLQGRVPLHTQEHLEDAMSTGTQSVASMPSSSLRDKLRDMRAASASRRVGVTGSARSTRSPSAFTEQAPRPELGNSKPSSVGSANSNHIESESLADAQLPLRIPQDSHLPYKPSHHALHKEMSQATSPATVLGSPRLGQMEFIVPLPMNGRVRDQYLQTVFIYRDAIEAFTGSEDHEPVLVDQVSEMVGRVNKVTTHTDLDNPETLTQPNAALEHEARWAENNSAKFMFLRHLFDTARPQEKHIAILAIPGRTLDILETFLKAHQIVYARPDKLPRRDTTAQGPLNVTLLPTGETGARFIVNNASLIVAFDHTFSVEDRHVQLLRAHMFNVGQLSPVISLIVANSAEHIDRCLSTSLDGSQRLRMLVSCIAQTRHNVGDLPPDALSPAAAAIEVAAYIALETPLEEYWRVPPIGEITGVTLFAESNPSDSSTQSAIPDSMRADGTPTMSKRALEDTDNLETSKKAKLTPCSQPGTVAQNTNESRLNISEGTQGVDHTTNQGESSSAQLNDATRPHVNEHEIVDVKVYQELSEKHQVEMQRIQSRLQEHVEALTELQYRFEDQNKEMVTLRGERDAAIAASAGNSRNLEKLKANIAKMKEEHETLAAELVDARTALLNSTPEVADLEKARAEARQAAADKARLENRIQSMTKELEFTRTQYQSASTAAAEASMEVVALQEENTVLKRKASGETAKLRQLNSGKDTETHLARIKELEQTLESREELLKRKEEEIKAQTRQRGLGTRASSNPRSPMPSRASSPASAFVGMPMGRGGHPLRYG